MPVRAYIALVRAGVADTLRIDNDVQLNNRTFVPCIPLLGAHVISTIPRDRPPSNEVLQSQYGEKSIAHRHATARLG